jgi:hypothetical protein
MFIEDIVKTKIPLLPDNTLFICYGFTRNKITGRCFSSGNSRGF